MKNNNKHPNESDIQDAWENSFRCLKSKKEFNRAAIYSCLLPTDSKRIPKFPIYFLRDVLTAYILNVRIENKWDVLKGNIELAKKEIHSKFPTNEILCPSCKVKKGLPIDRSQEAWAAEILGYFVRDDSHFGDEGVTHRCNACSHKWKSKKIIDQSILEYLRKSAVEQAHQRPF